MRSVVYGGVIEMSSSQSSKVEVLWSPNKDEDFATYSNELKLYAFKVRITGK